MLNITKNRIDQFVKLEQFKSGQIFKEQKHYKVIRKIIWAFVIVCILFLFLPWTQNIQGAGNVTTLKPNQRPQTIQTIIGGRIEKWYVNEGDFVKKGDTILLSPGCASFGLFKDYLDRANQFRSAVEKHTS